MCVFIKIYTSTKYKIPSLVTWILPIAFKINIKMETYE